MFDSEHEKTNMWFSSSLSGQTMLRTTGFAGINMTPFEAKCRLIVETRTKTHISLDGGYSNQTLTTTHNQLSKKHQYNIIGTRYNNIVSKPQNTNSTLQKHGLQYFFLFQSPTKITLDMVSPGLVANRSGWISAALE